MFAAPLLALACATDGPKAQPVPAQPAAPAPAPAAPAAAAPNVASTVPSGPVDPTAACPNCNVVWVTMDTTRADRMGFLGNTSSLTPNLDKLARRGTAWSRAYSQAPETTLSVASYFSGRYRPSNGMDFYLSEKDRVHPLSDELATVAEVFGGRGYRTAGIYANPLLWEKSNLNLHQGFDVWRAAPDEEVADIGLTLWQKGVKQEGKVFLYAHYFGPHTENTVLDGFARRRGTFASTLGNITEPLYTAVRTGKKNLSEDDVRYVRAMYDDAVWRMDEQIGALIAKIEATPEGAHTLWIVTADHGESLLEPASPPWLGHEAHLHEEMLHVPLLVVGPGVPAGKRTDEVSEVLDVAPTLMSLLGVPLDPAWRWEGDVLVGERATAGGLALSERGIWADREVSARDADHTAIKHLVGPTTACFDRGSDPHQAQPLADATPCAALLERIDHYVATANPPAPTGTTGSDAQTQEMLKQLGYTQ